MISAVISDSTVVPNSAASDASGIQKGMGKEAFLKLLVTQLQNQDPLKPMEDKEFTAQLAQFSSLEEMKNISKSIDGLAASQSSSVKTSAVGFIGKEVRFLDPAGSDSTMQGTVTSVRYESGEPYLIIGSMNVPLSSLLEVR